MFLILGILVFLSIILAVLKSTVLKTNKTTEKSLYTMFYEAGNRITHDNKQREIFANCLVEKARVRHGDRFEDIDFNDPKNINDVDVEACSEYITKMSWTKDTEERILRKFSSMQELTGLVEIQKMDYARCLLSKLKLKYPNGLNGTVPQEDMNGFYKDCLEALKIKSQAK
jgi:hypothetical protein